MGRGGMGKKQHSKDKMYLLQSEWQYEGGGFRGNKGAAAKLPFRRLPYNCCALTLSPFQDPMMTPAGVVYDMLNIIPYVNKNKRCPVTGQPMTLKDLVKLTFHKNDKGQFHCPVMFKEFTPHTHIVAIRTTGNVYCHEAVETLNLKTRNLKDLLTDQPFTKSDIITIQDPQNFDNREIEKFEHIKTGETHSALLKDAEINANEETRRILAKAGLTASSSSAATKRPAGEDGALVVSSAPKKPKPDSNAAAGSDDVKTRKGISSGAMAASFTSSAIDVVTSISEQTLSVMERRREIWSIMRQLGKKGYVQLKTTHGDINLEIRCDCVPQTSENFLTLCARGYYNGVKFHRVIKNFMMQGGDPTGTGKGGESMWKGKFEDEFDSRLRHDGRGVLSMANSGPNTNGSQFFITFKSCHHLDNKHSVFGSVVGGIEILKTIEKEVIVFVNPFEMDLPAYQEAQREKVEEERRAAELKKRREAEDAEGGKDWFTNPAAAAASKQTVYRTGVGKYLKPPTAKEIGSESGASAAAPVIEPTNTEDMWASVPEPPKKKPQPRPGLGNFSGW